MVGSRGEGVSYATHTMGGGCFGKRVVKNLELWGKKLYLWWVGGILDLKYITYLSSFRPVKQ
ncbi:MAG TPA: hypothetical protein DCY95_00755 [Algoriphagus sp.]|nr:hypothetical protein [Algoriphagus sp.]